MKAIIYFAIFFLLLSTHSYAENTLIFGQSLDPIADISAQVLSEAYKRINFEVKFIKMPAERSIENSNNGLLDGEVNRIAGIDKKYSDLIMIPFLINFLEGVAFTKKQNLIGIKALEPPLVKHDLFHYLNKKNEDFVPIIYEEIKKMQREGRISEIRKEFINGLVNSAY